VVDGVFAEGDKVVRQCLWRVLNVARVGGEERVYVNRWCDYSSCRNKMGQDACSAGDLLTSES
jgi:hypothetical protein